MELHDPLQVCKIKEGQMFKITALNTSNGWASSPSSNVAPYISLAVVVGTDKWSSESPGLSMLCAGFRRCCKAGGGSTMVVG